MKLFASPFFVTTFALGVCLSMQAEARTINFGDIGKPNYGELATVTGSFVFAGGESVYTDQIQPDGTNKRVAQMLCPAAGKNEALTIASLGSNSVTIGVSELRKLNEGRYDVPTRFAQVERYEYFDGSNIHSANLILPTRDVQQDFNPQFIFVSYEFTSANSLVIHNRIFNSSTIVKIPEWERQADGFDHSRSYDCWYKR